MTQKYVFYFLIFLITVLVFINPSFIFQLKKKLINFNENNNNELSNLEKENLILKSQLAKLSNLNNFLNKAPESKIKPAFVYSHYPFNLKNEILIDLGGEGDFLLNKAVVLTPKTQQTENQNFIFIGKIEKTYKNFSSVQTVFDPNFKLAVKIGQSQSDALFVGGPQPKLTLISNDSEVNTGDIIYSAQPNFPYGLIVGEVKEIKLLPDSVFKEALISFPYDLNKINLVGVLIE
jgi:cell shape-determining protein MreC